MLYCLPVILLLNVLHVCYFLAAFTPFVVASVVASVSWGAGVVRVEQTRRSLKFLSRLKVTRGGWGMARFSFFKAYGGVFLDYFCQGCESGYGVSWLLSCTRTHEYMDNVCDI